MAAHGRASFHFSDFARRKYASRQCPVPRLIGWCITCMQGAIAQPLSAGLRHRGDTGFTVAGLMRSVDGYSSVTSTCSHVGKTRSQALHLLDGVEPRRKYRKPGLLQVCINYNMAAKNCSGVYSSSVSPSL